MLQGRNALVTGAGGGIGSATACLLAERGMNVWLTYATGAAGARETVAACEEHGVRARASALDLRSPTEVAALLERIGAEWGALNVLVNNAGTCPYTAWDEITLDEWDAVLETNARGTFATMREAVPLLRAGQGDRAIVNVASLAGQVGGITTSVHYAASKAAVLALTRSFARLLAPDHIRVNAVSPGPIATAITAQMPDGARAALAESIPVKRLGRPSEVASAICLLASPESGFTTGATYDVNGGLLMD